MCHIFGSLSCGFVTLRSQRLMIATARVYDGAKVDRVWPWLVKTGSCFWNWNGATELKISALLQPHPKAVPPTHFRSFNGVAGTRVVRKTGKGPEIWQLIACVETSLQRSVILLHISSNFRVHFYLQRYRHTGPVCSSTDEPPPLSPFHIMSHHKWFQCKNRGTWN